MIMKKIFAFLLGITLLWSCNPLEDTYQLLDDAKEPYSESIEYTLVEADYVAGSNFALQDAQTSQDSALAKAIKSNMAFNSRFQGKDYVPKILSNLFPALSKGSSAIITYSEFIDQPSFFTDMSSIYYLTTDDYKKLWNSSTLFVEALTPSLNPQDTLAYLLGQNFPGDADGKYRFISYNYSSDEATTEGGLLPLVVYDFQEGIAYDPVANGWINKNIKGTKQWTYRSYSGNLYAQFSSFNTGEENEVWLTRMFDQLDTIDVPTLAFKVKIGYWNASCLSILISENFDGNENNIASATWTDITSNFTIPEEPASGYGSFVDAGNYDLSAFKGKTIYVAFRYVGNGVDNSATTTYQIDDVTVANNATVLKINSSEKKYAAYVKNGSLWQPASDIHVLNSTDYLEMGFADGYIPSPNEKTFLPIYLNQKMPYAQEGDIVNVAYRNNKSTVTSAAVSQFIKTNGVWVLNDFGQTFSDQFFNNGSIWFYDPTIHLELSGPDYQLLVDWVYTNLDRVYGSSYGNDEFYYGASAYYSNFDLRLSKRTQYNIPGFEGLSEQDQIALTWERVQEGISILLSEKYPDAVSEVSGFPLYYFVYFKTYENDLSSHSYVGIFQKTKDEYPYFERKTIVEDEMVSQGKLTLEQVSWNRAE